MSDSPNKHITTPLLWLYQHTSGVNFVQSDALPSWLTDSETHRFRQLSLQRQHQFLISRWLIRHALSSIYDKPNEWWQVEEQTGGPPCIKNLPEKIYLSISHSHNSVGITLAQVPIGLDVEYIKQRNFSKVAQLFMNKREYEIFKRSPGSASFYQSWCLKEAVYKASPFALQKQLRFDLIDTTRILADKRNTVFEQALHGYQLTLFVDAVIPSLRVYQFDEKNLHWHDSLLTPSFR